LYEADEADEVDEVDETDETRPWEQTRSDAITPAGLSLEQNRLLSLSLSLSLSISLSLGPALVLFSTAPGAHSGFGFKPTVDPA
jgi:hypothetical protein